MKNFKNIDNSKKDIKMICCYVDNGRSYTEQIINDFLSKVSCEIVSINTTDKQVFIFYKTI